MNYAYSEAYKGLCVLWNICDYYFASSIESLDKSSIKCPGIYIFINSMRIPVYVGRSDNLAQRLVKSHKGHKKGDEIIMITCLHEERSRLLERVFVGAFQPERNVKKGEV